MNANERHHRARHAFLAVLELLTLALLVAGLSWTLLRTAAHINLHVNDSLRVELHADNPEPIRIASGF